MILILSVIILTVWLFTSTRRRIGYEEGENKAGPTPDITQEEMDSVMKFVNA
jgi:hypothetical protein